MQRIMLYGKLFAYLTPPVLLTIIIFFVIVSSMPTSAYRPDYRIAGVSRELMPEGWSFFTRSPREEEADLYLVEGKEVSKLTDCNGEPANLFGISRKSRKIGMDISFLANVTNLKWENVTRQSNYAPFKDTFRRRWDERVTTVKPGLYILSVYKPIPWAWRNTYPSVQRKYKVAMINYGNSN